MATIVIKVDDLDHYVGKDNPAEAEETLAFNVDGVAYYLELSAENAGRFRAVMRPFVEAATRIGAARIAVPGGVILPKKVAERVALIESGKDDLDEWYLAKGNDTATVRAKKKAYRQTVRKFWNDRGHALGERGRVPRVAYVAYAAYEAQQKQSDKTESRADSA